MRNEFVRAARDLKKYSKDLEKAIAKANDRTAKAGLKEAVKSSSGNKTAADRRKAGYPFARRHGSPLWDASIINVGRGDFRNEWHIEATPEGPAIINFSKVAGYLKDGTNKMFARPIETRIIAAMSKVGVDNLDREVQKLR